MRLRPAVDSLCSCSTGGDTDENSDSDVDGNCRGSDRGRLCGSDTYEGNIVL